MTNNLSINDFEDVFQKILQQPELDKNLYWFIHNLSTVLVCWKDRQQDTGWAAGCKAATGDSIFTVEEAVKIEDLFEDAAPVLKKMFKDSSIQAGGAADITETLKGLAANYLKPEDISLDRLYRRFSNYMGHLDEQNRELARQIGPLAITSSLKMDPSIPIPFPPFRLSLPANSILPLLNGIMEILRIIFTFAIPVDGLRKLLTVFQTVLDVARGEWKYGIFTFMGYFGTMPLVIGVALKLVRDAWLFISPQIREQLQDDMFHASKSFFAGFILWIFATFAPDFIRTPIDTALTPARALVENINNTIDVVEEKAKAAAKPMGLDVIFARIPIDSVPSFTNIQQIQRIIQQPEIFCNSSVRTVLEPFKKIPPIRLALELMNIPIDDEERARQCTGFDENSSITDSILLRMKPVVKPL